MHFLPLNVQNQQRSSEHGGIFSLFPKNALQARSEGNLCPSLKQNKQKQSLYPSPFPPVTLPADDRQLGHPQASSNVPGLSQPCPTQRQGTLQVSPFLWLLAFDPCSNSSNVFFPFWMNGEQKKKKSNTVTSCCSNFLFQPWKQVPPCRRQARVWGSKGKDGRKNASF